MNDRAWVSSPRTRGVLALALDAGLVGLFFLAAVWPAAAAAREVIDGGLFVTGYAIPLSRPGHTLAFLAIGIWSARWGGAAIWQMPVAAAAGAVVAGILAASGFSVPYLDQVLPITLVILGLTVALPVPLPYPLLTAALLASFHGIPHAGGGADPFSYWGGFAVGVLLAAAAGIGVTGIVSLSFGGIAVRAVGVAISAFGALVLMDRI